MLPLLPVPLRSPDTYRHRDRPPRPRTSPQVLWSRSCTRAICVELVTVSLPKPYLMPLTLRSPNPPSLSLETCPLV